VAKQLEGEGLKKLFNHGCEEKNFLTTNHAKYANPESFGLVAPKQPRRRICWWTGRAAHAFSQHGLKQNVAMLGTDFYDPFMKTSTARFKKSPFLAENI
jgi:hypothetical protein